MSNNASSKPKPRRAKGTGRIFTRGKTYYLEYTVNGKKTTTSLRVTTLKDAEKKAKEFLDPVLHSEDKVRVIENIARARKVIRPSTLDLEKVWQTYLKVPEEDRPKSSPGTLGNYKRNWKEFKTWLNKKHPAIQYLSDQIDETIAKQYRDELKALNLADTTFNYKIGSLKLIFRILKDKANLNGNVWNCINRISHPKQETKQNFTFPQALELLKVFEIGYKYKDKNKRIQSFNPMHKEQLETLFFIGIYSGLRLIDCVKLRWSHIIKFETGLAIRCKPQKTIKFDKSITAPIVRPLQDALTTAKEWKDDTDYICPDIAARYNYNPTGVRKDVVKVFKVAGYTTSRIKDGAAEESRKYSAYGFHSLRHSLFSFLCANGVTMDKLKAWSGDSEKTLLKYYLHAETEKMISDAQETLTFTEVLPATEKTTDQITNLEPERLQMIDLAKSLPLKKVKEINKIYGENL